MARRLCLALLALATSITLAAPAHAQTPPGLGWTLEPATATGAGAGRSFFDYSIAPGAAVQDFVKLSNLTDRQRTFILYSADAYTTEQGGFALRLRDQPRDALGAWVSLPFTTRTVAPGTSITFPFQLGIPRETSPGDWAGGIVAVATDDVTVADPARESTGVHIEQGVATRIYARVKGALHAALTITSVDVDSSGGAWAPLGSKGQLSVRYEVVNTGNVRLAGTASVEITDVFGRTVKTIPARQLPELLPRDHTVVSEMWNGPPLIGFRYRARVVLDAGGQHTARSTPAVWHLSLALFLGAIGVLWVVWLAVAHRRGVVARLRRIRRHPSPDLVPT